MGRIKKADPLQSFKCHHDAVHDFNLHRYLGRPVKSQLKSQTVKLCTQIGH